MSFIQGKQSMDWEVQCLTSSLPQGIWAQVTRSLRSGNTETGYGGGGDFPIRLAVPLNTMHLRLGLDLTVFQLRSHTWFQHSVKLRFLMSHCRKNSVRDKVIGNKWIYLKRNTLHRQCGLSQNVSCCSVTQLCPTLCYPMD